MHELRRVVLGNLPLLGISYQNEQKDIEYRKKFSNKNEMKRIMKVGIKYKVRNFSASSHDFNELAPLHLQALKELEKEEKITTPLIACQGIPVELRGKRINDYRRWATHLNYEMNEFGKEVRVRYFDDPILNFRSNWQENLSMAKAYDKKELQKGLKINWDRWDRNLQKFSGYKVDWIEPGSEIDLLALCRMDLLEELQDRTLRSGYRILLGSHHLGVTAHLIEEGNMKRFDGYVTPVNKFGLMMFPTQIEVERAIEKAKKDGKIIVGVKPFAGGRVKPREALEYVYKKANADLCMIGVGSVEEAEEDFQIAENILKSR